MDKEFPAYELNRLPKELADIAKSFLRAVEGASEETYQQAYDELDRKLYGNPEMSDEAYDHASEVMKILGL